MNKLNNHIKGLFAIALSLLIIVGSSGFRIYIHHCNKNQTDNYSFFNTSATCNMHTAKPVVKSCCQNQEHTKIPNCNSISDDNDCCSNKTQVVKLETKTLIYNSTFEIKPFETASFMMLLVFNDTAFETKNTALLTHRCAESPPPLSTTDYLACIQVYLI